MNLKSRRVLLVLTILADLWLIIVDWESHLSNNISVEGQLFRQ